MEPLPRATPATIDVLRVLMDAEDAVWGLRVVKETGRPTGSVYPILDRLEQLGWVVSSWEEDSGRQGPRRRYYRLRTEARKVAAAAVVRFDALQRKARVPRRGLDPAGA